MDQRNPWGAGEPSPRSVVGGSVGRPAVGAAAWTSRWAGGAMVAVVCLGVVTALISWSSSRQLAARPTTNRSLVDATPVTNGGGEACDDEADALCDRAVVVPDDGGIIAELVLHYTFDHDASVAPTYRDLFAKLSGSTDLLICCPSWEDAKAFTSRWGREANLRGREVIVVTVNRALSLWSRDRRIARETLSHEPALTFVPTLSENIEEEKRNELLLPFLLWTTGTVPGTCLISFELEGGNLIGVRSGVFTGLNVLGDNEDRFATERDLARVLRRVFGREPVVLGDREGQVPWPHADMYLTVVGEKTVLLADLVAGLELLKRVPEEDARRFRLATEPQVVNVAEEEGWTIQRSLDDIAEQLGGLGFKVVRVPALMAASGDAMVTYNNVLMEDSGEVRVVYMPVYGMAALDQAMEQVYTRCGMEVRTVDVSGLYELGGAIRCVANVTRRYAPGYVPGPRPAHGSIRVLEVDGPDSVEDPERKNLAVVDEVASGGL